MADDQCVRVYDPLGVFRPLSAQSRNRSIEWYGCPIGQDCVAVSGHGARPGPVGLYPGNQALLLQPVDGADLSYHGSNAVRQVAGPAGAPSWRDVR